MIPLQSPGCSASRWLSGEWHTCIFEPFVTVLSEPVFGMIIGSALWLGFYFASGGRWSAPTAVTILVSTLLFPALPGNLVNVASGVLTIGVAAVILQVLQRYVLNPSTAR